jgi:hypothetical protein
MKKPQPISSLGVSMPETTCGFWCVQGNLWSVSCPGVYRSDPTLSRGRTEDMVCSTMKVSTENRLHTVPLSQVPMGQRQ